MSHLILICTQCFFIWLIRLISILSEPCTLANFYIKPGLKPLLVIYAHWCQSDKDIFMWCHMDNRLFTDNMLEQQLTFLHWSHSLHIYQRRGGAFDHFPLHLSDQPTCSSLMNKTKEMMVEPINSQLGVLIQKVHLQCKLNKDQYNYM
jgi:hypothetical protein